MAFPIVGRGRGRARNLHAALSKPGPSKYTSLSIAPVPPTQSEELSTLLTTCLKNPSQQTNIQLLRTQVRSFVSVDGANTAKLIILLCNKCYADSDLASTAGEIASVLVALPSVGIAIRTVLLKAIQDAFVKREEQAGSDFDSYLGFVTMFCSLYKSLRVNGEPFKPLTGPVYQVLDELLDGRASSPVQRENEIEAFHNCLLMVGETLECCDKTKMNELFKKVRKTILKKGTQKMRCLLLETLEYHITSWAGDNDLRVFYGDLLSDIMAT